MVDGVHPQLKGAKRLGGVVANNPLPILAGREIATAETTEARADKAAAPSCNCATLFRIPIFVFL